MNRASLLYCGLVFAFAACENDGTPFAPQPAPDTVFVERTDTVIREVVLTDTVTVPGPERVVTVVPDCPDAPSPELPVVEAPEPELPVVEAPTPERPVIKAPSPEQPAANRPDAPHAGTLSFDGRMRVGVVFGREVNDHLDRPGIRPAVDALAEAAAPVRVYYLQGADFVTERDPASGVQPLPPAQYDGSLPWGVYSNKVRMANLRDAGVRNPLVSTEAFRPREPWTWKYFDAGEWVGPWVRRFVTVNNDVWGVGQWTWQIASEPWNERWPAYARALLDGYLSVPDSLRPRIAYAALPVSQGDSRVLADGYPTNGFWPGTLSEFVLPEWRPHVDVLTVHAYPLDFSVPGVWTSAKIEASIEEGLAADRWRDEHLPSAELWVTEYGAPFSAPWSIDYYRRTYDAWDEAGIERAYVYSLKSIDGGAHFVESYILDDATGARHPAFKALVR